MRKRYLLLLLCWMIALSPLWVLAEESIPLEQMILQQHFTQKELERNLALIKEEEKDLIAEIAHLTMETNRQALVIDAMRRHAGHVAYTYYTGQRQSLLLLLLNAQSFNDFMRMLEFLQLLFERDMKQLQSFQEERTKAELLQQTKQARLARVQQIRRQYEEQLQQIIAIQAEKERNLQLIDDPTAVQTLMDHLISDWQGRGLPAFRTFFEQLSKVMLQIPELVSSERIKSEGFFTHTLTINEEEFNQFLIGKNDLFRQSRFQFDDNQLIVDGHYDQMNIRIVGQYELVSPQELQFHITELLFDGFQLPATTIEEMEKEYDLGFYPALINPNVMVDSLILDNQELKLKLSLQLPFGSKSPWKK